MTKQLLFRNFFSFLFFALLPRNNRTKGNDAKYFRIDRSDDGPPYAKLIYGTAKLVLAVKSREKRKVGKSSTLHRTQRVLNDNRLCVDRNVEYRSRLSTIET